MRVTRQHWPVVISLVAATLAARGEGEQRFLGGGRDGHDEGTVLAVPAAARAGWYIGGPNDGQAFNVLLWSPGPGREAWFAGGSRDGYGNAAYAGFDPTFAARPFRGGPRDGSALGAAAGFVNPLDRDTDGDGLPDWWELPNFGWITNASPRADTDADSADAIAEFTADTDPNDPNSFFRVTAIAPGAAWALTFTCSPARVYSLQSTAHVKTGVWERVEGMTEQPGEPDGLMTLSGTNADPGFFYRVDVKFPP